ncbi:hypothetical protein F9U64_11125 [Gracilibacillus oryzae]|uniref:Uncharacterized protein n=1 Tax=Gracilibacillus oryzae TaxID=1672701 RepID=A0A7C8GSZ2_9BACI|nr:hypothetical protein [Gracilibacillus oryzae]KAB8134687.1 hypothetical protein F9U64_11125 [Gracilibacillus oryzae]
MTFSSKMNGLGTALICILIALNTIRASVHNGTIIFVVYFIIVIILGIYLNYRVTIDEQFIHYTVLFGNFTIYARKISAEQIKEIKGKRINWYRMGATVKMKQGVNYRLNGFSPESIFYYLEDFAEKNNVTLNGSKDYQVLRRRQDRLNRQEINKRKSN